LSIALIGHTGFVGGTLCRTGSFNLLINRANLATLRGQRLERVVCAGLPAAKWIANREPAADGANMESLRDVLATVEARQFVLISTIDVYPETVGHDEDYDCSLLPNHAYGANRLAFEQFVRTRFPHAHIIRLPGLFGPGLRKNVIHDLLHENGLAAINPESTFQWYPITRLANDLSRVEKAGLRLVNLFTEPLQTREILERFFPGKQVGAAPASCARYELRTKHANVFGRSDGYIMGRDAVLMALSAYLRGQGLSG